MIAAADHTDLVEQIDTALEVAVEAHQEACRLLGVARVFARRLEDAQVGAVENTNSDEVDEMEESQELVAADQTVLPDAMEYGGVSLLDPGQSDPKATRVSPSRFERLTGITPAEFRTGATLSDSEFEIADKSGGIRPYLKARSTKPPEAATPAAGELLEAAE
jgi:hypothetical protein